MVTATHFHIDHVAGISGLLELFPEIRVCFSTMVGDYLKGKDRICLLSPFKWLKGLLPVVMASDDHIRKSLAALFSDRIEIQSRNL